MRHRKKSTKLGRTTSHKEAMLASMVCDLIESRRIKTTLSKAKAVRPLAEKMVTLGKKGDIAARRLAVSRLNDKKAVAALFDTVAPALAERQGGYTRIMKLGKRVSDSSEMALLEWTDSIGVEPKPAKKKKEKPEEEKN